MKDYVAHHYVNGELYEVMFITRPYLTRRDVKRFKWMLDVTGAFTTSDCVAVFTEPGHNQIMVITEKGIER